ncbi:MAG: hypothetical protein A07HB70_00651 [uncultured archaeon A07HB70]|nr:MAG: hypothetical protein A07HB70_00651 [uncultured archaeon A07HB70]
MNPVVLVRRLFWGTVTTLALAATGISGFLAVRGPLLGGEVLDPQPLVLAAGVFLIGIILVAIGGTKFFRALRT